MKINPTKPPATINKKTAVWIMEDHNLEIEMDVASQTFKVTEIRYDEDAQDWVEERQFSPLQSLRIAHAHNLLVPD